MILLSNKILQIITLYMIEETLNFSIIMPNFIQFRIPRQIGKSLQCKISL